MGGFHARVCAENPSVELVAVVDSVVSQAQTVAAKHGVQGLPSAESLLGRIKAAVVAVPTIAHVSVAGPLLERGISCLVEKPLAATSTEAALLVKAAAKGRATLQVGHSERFNPAFMALSKYNLRPRFVEATRVSPCRFRSMDIGVVMDMMIHDIDLVLSLVRSEVVSVDAVGVNVVGATEDMANVRVRFANGCVADLTASRASLKVERRIRVFAESGYAAVDFGAKRGTFVRPSAKLEAMRKKAMAAGQFDPTSAVGEEFEKLLTVEQIEINDHDALARQLAAFVASVTQGEPVVVTGDDGRRAVELAEQIVRAVAAQH
jgi:predicted dehydrogenase